MSNKKQIKKHIKDQKTSNELTQSDKNEGMSDDYKNIRKKYFDCMNKNNPITFVDTSEYSMKNYVYLTGAVCLFWDDDLMESVSFGYIGVKQYQDNNYFFVDIKKCHWLEFDEIIDATLNTYRRMFFWLYQNNKITLEQFMESMNDLVTNKNQIGIEVKEYLEK